MKIEDIITAYFLARKNKRKSPDQVEFELHWEMNCKRLCDDVNNRCVRPTAYTFVVNHPKPREIFASDMYIRILHHYIDMRIRPLLETLMSKHTYNNRVGMGTVACQNAVISDIYEVSKCFTTDAWIIKLDLKGCFPNINQDIAYKQLLDVINKYYEGEDKDDLIYILGVCVYSYPTKHCYRKSPLHEWKKIPKEKSIFSKKDGIGAAIGHLIWQNAVNFYFTDIDRWMESTGICYERYVDDLYFITNNKTAFLSSIIPVIRKMLNDVGAALNENKFYCQHYTKGCECLGIHIKRDRIYPNKRVVYRAIQKAINSNRCIRKSKIHKIISQLNSYLGVCKNTNGYNQAMKIISKMSEKWFDYLNFNTKRVCLQPKYNYSERNFIIEKYNLK